jgi:hypothetical protein
MITPIREKELGDWKNISLEEKKLLYRYSFAQTMSEFRAPRGYSKVGWAGFFAVMGVCTLYSVFLQAFCKLSTQGVRAKINFFIFQSIQELIRWWRMSLR